MSRPIHDIPTDEADDCGCRRPEGGRPAALLVCHDAGHRSWGPRWLHRAGLDAELVIDPVEAAERAASARPAVIVVEAGMKTAGGSTLLEELLAGRHGAPVLALCGPGREIRAALELGAADVVRRPIDWQIAGLRAAALAQAQMTRREASRLRSARDRALEFAEETRRHLERRETLDPLTELPNRKIFVQQVERTLGIARPGRGGSALLLVDLDRFGQVNESLGRRQGNAVLTMVGQRLEECLRGFDLASGRRVGLITATLARLGGDQFGLLFTDSTGPRGLEGAARTVLQALSDPFEVGGQRVYLTASVGAALYPADGDTAEELLQGAEVAMVEAKAAGGGAYRFYRRTNEGLRERRRELERALRAAFERRELFLHYQPLVDVAGGSVVGAEALLRWTHPVHGAVPPDEFIPIAEESGLMVPLGAWVLRTACRELRRWMETGLPPIRLAVNVSHCQLRRGDLAQVVARVLEETGLAPAQLELELSERGVLRNERSTVTQLEELKRLGVRLSVDDFGTGDSAIAYLRRLPIDVLKVDRSYVSGSQTDTSDRAIASAVVAMAHQLRLAVVAEGVENHEQMTFLQDLGCDEYQGFYFSSPLPGEEFQRLWRDARSRGPRPWQESQP